MTYDAFYRMQAARLLQGPPPPPQDYLGGTREHIARLMQAICAEAGENGLTMNATLHLAGLFEIIAFHDRRDASKAAASTHRQPSSGAH